MTIAESNFTLGDVVWVPFPFIEVPQERMRPALIISDGAIGGMHKLLWVVMITSAANRGWKDDISLETCFEMCGLHVPCVIRPAKISTIEAGRAKKLGAVPSVILEQVQSCLFTYLGQKVGR